MTEETAIHPFDPRVFCRKNLVPVTRGIRESPTCPMSLLTDPMDSRGFDFKRVMNDLCKMCFWGVIHTPKAFCVARNEILLFLGYHRCTYLTVLRSLSPVFHDPILEPKVTEPLSTWCLSSEARICEGVFGYLCRGPSQLRKRVPPESFLRAPMSRVLHPDTPRCPRVGWFRSRNRVLYSIRRILHPAGEVGRGIGRARIDLWTGD